VPANVLLALDEAYIEFLNEPLDLLPGNPERWQTEPAVDADILEDLRPGRFADWLWHRASRFHCCAGKNRQPFNINSVAQAGALAALDGQQARRENRAKSTRADSDFTRAPSQAELEFVPSQRFHPGARGRRPARCRELQKLGVDCAPDGRYQLPEWIRISIGTTKENQRCL